MQSCSVARVRKIWTSLAFFSKARFPALRKQCKILHKYYARDARFTHVMQATQGPKHASQEKQNVL